MDWGLACMSWRGGFSMDEAVRDKVSGGTCAPHFQSSGVSPTPVTGGPHSNGGFEYDGGDGGPSVNFWDAATSGNNWYYVCFVLTVISGTTGDAWDTVYFQHQNSNVTGAVRLKPTWASATTYTQTLEYYDGSAWVASSASTTVFTVGTIYYLRVRIDTSGTGAGRAGLSVSGGAEECVLAPTVSLLATTPSFRNSAVKGTGSTTYRCWEILCNDTNASPGPSTAQAYTSANSDVHCYGAVPRRDVAGDGAWAQASWHTDRVLSPPTTGLLYNAYTGRFRWAQVDSPYDVYAVLTSEDHMFIAANSTDLDWLFGFNQYSGSEAVQGVGISWMLQYTTSYGLPDKVVARLYAATPVAVTAFAGGAQAGFGGMYKFLKGLPASLTTAWTMAHFNNLEAGPRCSSALGSPPPPDQPILYHVHDFLLHVIGTNLSKPDTAGGFVSPPGRVALGSGNVMVV